MSDFIVNAEVRNDLGKGASRRLRREGKVPGVIYGAGKEPQSIMVNHNELIHHIEDEAFYAHILNVKLDGKDEQAIVKDMQRHPSKPMVTHIDFQRVAANEKLHVRVPLHYVNEEAAPGVKAGGLVTHSITEVEISCLPKNLPEFIEVDLSTLELDASLHLSDIKCPSGVELVELSHGSDHDQSIASIHLPRGAKEDAAEEAAEGGEEA